MAHIESLLELQTLDLQIDKTHKRLTQIKATLAGSDDLNKAIHFVKTIQMELERLNKSRRGFETEIHKLDQRKESIETRLYDGSITNSKELTAHQEELTILLESKSQLEEQLLAIMLRLDEYVDGSQKATSHLEFVEKQHHDEVSKAKIEQKNLTKLLNNNNTMRDNTRASLSTASLGIYDRLRKVGTMDVMAQIEGTLCAGCRLTVPSGKLQQVRSSTEIVQCNSCSRILYFGG